MNLPALLSRRKALFLAIATVPFLGVVAAFGIAPDTTTANLRVETVVENLAIEEAHPTDSGAFDFWREERLLRGQTLSALLTNLGVREEDRLALLEAARKSPALSRLTPGRTVLARVTSSGRLLLLRYLSNDTTLVTADRVEEKFRIREQAIQPEMRPIMRSGTIQSSLYGATDAADVPDRIASELAEIFSGDVDFHRDLRKGDHFSVVYEAFYHEGQMIRSGRLIAAEFTNAGKSHQAVYFKDPQGREGYYSGSGESLRRAFLKSPMPFSRISSGFTASRFHPVLQLWRSHKGVDYAAPTGAPVRAVADAVVSFVGRQGGYGNLVVLNHQKPYSTAYGHLSKFGKGIKRGARVSQGQVIGHVGATGLASGPHLHYEFRIDGAQKNPLTVKLPSSLPLDSRYKPHFAAYAKPYTARLELLRSSNLAKLD
ncbi:MAG: peptidoglycan DD-metalloendopeptidase family protein [Betaproteobacteria bacterium]|nr:peptidoglycan DD-metalloendopeptidase family protein [Betaproteobacteria bacterium]